MAAKVSAGWEGERGLLAASLAPGPVRDSASGEQGRE